ncbi:MAG TPA: alcohol dehydrogenase catalytic domain-containing protein, partial [Solirubrobacteraceae bacterium]
MRGIVFHGNRKLELFEFTDPTPGPGDVVVAMKASGMCGSDLHAYRAPGDATTSLGLGGRGGPVIAGHEPCGVVEALGASVGDAQARVGERVMIHHYKGCGRCKHCRVGWSQLCPRGCVVYGMTGHGGHAPFMTVPARTLVPLPEA